jgi:hypothetical protein
MRKNARSEKGRVDDDYDDDEELPVNELRWWKGKKSKLS